MKYWKKAFGAFVLGTSLTACSLTNNSVKPYVDNNLDDIIKNQEKILGIKHLGKPHISYGFPCGFSRSFFSGGYSAEENVIYLTKEYVITPEFNLDNATQILNYGPKILDNTHDVLNHELAHFYMDKLGEKKGFGSWPNYDDFSEIGERVGILLVSEGIAEYFERASTGKNIEDNFLDFEWPIFPEEYFVDMSRFIYDGGYHLVKPILDLHGVRGIEYFMFNPPSSRDLENLTDYQIRSLYKIDKLG